MILARHQTTYRGRWCRDCGTATFRNLASYNRIRALAQPTTPGGTPSLQPGRALVARPGLWVFALVLVSILVLIVTHAR